jgi:nucleotidyltransferase/DNA polymerase involved in DNA repair
VTLKIRFCGFETHTRQRRLPRHSDDARTLFAAAWSLYEAGRWQGKPVRLIGLGIADLGALSRSSHECLKAPPGDLRVIAFHLFRL